MHLANESKAERHRRELAEAMLQSSDVVVHLPSVRGLLRVGIGEPLNGLEEDELLRGGEGAFDAARNDRLASLEWPYEQVWVPKLSRGPSSRPRA